MRAGAGLNRKKLEQLPARALLPLQYVVVRPYDDPRSRSRRRNQLVLEDLAAVASYGYTTPWGTGALPSVPVIAERIGYSVRSVQYALRELAAHGRIELLDARAGRTWVYRIVRHVEPAPDPAGERDDPVIETAPPAGATVAGCTGGCNGCTRSCGSYQEFTPPPPVEARQIESEPAAPALNAAQSAPRAGPDGPEPHPPPALALVAEPHRRDAGAPAAAETAGPSPDDPPPGVSAPLSESRGATRARRCPKCRAAPGQPCTGYAGRPRRGHHAERRAAPTPERVPWPAWCGGCDDERTRLVEIEQDGRQVCAPCPRCHPKSAPPCSDDGPRN